MKALVTGGSGYFGTALVKLLGTEGYQVRVFDLNPPEEQCEFEQGDIRDLEAVRRACRGVQVVHHNVAQVPLARDRALFDSVNRVGTQNLLQASLAEGVSKVVYTSSSAVFGVPPVNPVVEDTPAVPQEAYGRAKLEGEKLCRDYAARGLDVTIIRPRTILGHGRLGIFQILFEWVRRGYNIPVLGSGDNLYQFVHSDDLARACLLAGAHPGSDCFNIGAQRFTSMRKTLETLTQHAGTGSRVRSLPMALTVVGMKLAYWLGLSPLGPYHSLMYGRSLYFDCAHARRQLGWQAEYSNAEMICQSYDWYLENRERVLAAQPGRSLHQSSVRQGVLALVGKFL